MPSIRLDHIAIALPRIAAAPSVLVAVLGGVPARTDVDPTAAEGPLAIELASGRGLPDLEGAGARLGIRLAQRFA